MFRKGNDPKSILVSVARNPRTWAPKLWEGEFQRFAFMISAIALVPAEDLMDTMQYMQCPTEAKELLNYVDATYVELFDVFSLLPLILMVPRYR